MRLQPLSGYSWNRHSQLYRIPRAATPRGIKMTATIDAFLGPNAFWRCKYMYHNYGVYILALGCMYIHVSDIIPTHIHSFASSWYCAVSPWLPEPTTSVSSPSSTPHNTLSCSHSMWYTDTISWLWSASITSVACTQAPVKPRGWVVFHFHVTRLAYLLEFGTKFTACGTSGVLYHVMWSELC